MEIAIVVAVSDNGIIGAHGSIPWAGRASADMERFRKLTQGHVVVMGRKTFQSLPERFKPLPNRINVVLTRQPHGELEWLTPSKPFTETIRDPIHAMSLKAGGTTLTVMGSLDEVFEVAAERRIFLIGGSELYTQSLADERVRKVYRTRVHSQFQGDSEFPELDSKIWSLVEETKRYLPAEGKNYPLTFEEYERVQ